MTRTYAAKRLLEHGPLTFAEFLSITGWTISQSNKTIQALVQQGIVCTLHRVGCRRKIYALAQELAGVGVAMPSELAGVRVVWPSELGRVGVVGL